MAPWQQVRFVAGWAVLVVLGMVPIVLLFWGLARGLDQVGGG
jgi:hypothetical protein